MIIRTLSLLLLTVAVQAQEAATVNTIPMRNGLYMLQGRGGNVMASVGIDGVFIVDSDYANMQPAYKAAISTLGTDQVRFVVNTHWHSDHTGGNEAWGKSGGVIMAHQNVRERLSTPQDMKAFDRVVEPSHRAAWPLVTFRNSMALHLNGETIEVVHFPKGHTDGDSMVFFLEPNIVHTGDHYFRDRFPFVDIDSGGSVAGLKKNIAKLLSTIDEQTIIVPGHGSLARKPDLQRYHDMIEATIAEVHAMQDEGLDLEAIQAKGLDAKWASWGSGFIKEAFWISIIYNSPR